MAWVGPCASLFALALALSLLLSACGAAPAPSPEEAKTAGTTATLRVDPSPPVPLAEATLELTLRDRAGQPISGAVVELDLTMPGMAMPLNRPAVTEVGNGTYRAQAIFTMAGDWQIQVDASYAGGSERFTFLVSTR